MPKFNIKREDKVRLRHMLDAALEIQQYAVSSKREDLNQDRKLVHSLVRLFEKLLVKRQARSRKNYVKAFRRFPGQ